MTNQELENLIVDAFLRGESWKRRNGITGDAPDIRAGKAARDYADYTIGQMQYENVREPQEFGEGATVRRAPEND